MKKTITVDICDVCLDERASRVDRCFVCGKDLCHVCRKRHSNSPDCTPPSALSALAPRGHPQ